MRVHPVGGKVSKLSKELQSCCTVTNLVTSAAALLLKSSTLYITA